MILDLGEAEREINRLHRAAEGYLHVYGRGPLESMRPVGVELRLAAPILNPSTGSEYAPVSYVVRDHRGLRLAATGEFDRAEKVRWPFYQVATVDLLMQERDNPDRLWVWEAKSASSPETRLLDLSIDPQVQGYAWIVGDAAKRGHLEHLGVSRNAYVAGYVFDVASSSYQYDPKPLKPRKVKALHPETGEPYKDGSRWVYELDADGKPIETSPGMSVSKSRTVPSWRFRAGLIEHGFDLDKYADHLAELATSTDPRLYVRSFGTAGAEVVDRYQREIYGFARRLAAMRRATVNATSPSEIAEALPRQPVCALPGGMCRYRGPCLQDGDHARVEFETSDGIRWIPDDMTPDQEELGW